MLYLFSAKLAQHSYSSTQFSIPSSLAKQILDWNKKNIPESDLYIDPDDSSFGRETSVHVTIKYGLHTSVPDKVKDIVSGFGSFLVSLGSVSRFEADGYDVIKIDVLSKKLHELNKLISENLECTDTHPVYKPHLTLAYVKKGRCVKLLGDKKFQGEEVKIDEIVFSDKFGKKHRIRLGESND